MWDSNDSVIMYLSKKHPPEKTDPTTNTSILRPKVRKPHIPIIYHLILTFGQEYSNSSGKRTSFDDTGNSDNPYQELLVDELTGRKLLRM